MGLRNLLQSFGIKFHSPIPLHCDSKSAIYLAANPVFHERTKHVENDCHFIRDEIVKDFIATKHVSTHDQLADIFTKPLGRKEFDDFLPKLGVLDLHSPIWGGVLWIYTENISVSDGYVNIPIVRLWKDTLELGLPVCIYTLGHWPYEYKKLFHTSLGFLTHMIVSL